MNTTPKDALESGIETAIDDTLLVMEVTTDEDQLEKIGQQYQELIAQQNALYHGSCGRTDKFDKFDDPQRFLHYTAEHSIIIHLATANPGAV